MTITSIGIIGAGTMGNGIAQVAASAGYDVVLLDVSDAALEKGLAALNNSLDRLIKKEVISAEQKSQTLARIKTSTQYADLASVSLVIEAATENQTIKESILQQVDRVVSKDTIIASNTSSISITPWFTQLTARAFYWDSFFQPPTPNGPHRGHHGQANQSRDPEGCAGDGCSHGQGAHHGTKLTRLCRQSHPFAND